MREPLQAFAKSSVPS